MPCLSCGVSVNKPIWLHVPLETPIDHFTQQELSRLTFFATQPYPGPLPERTKLTDDQTCHPFRALCALGSQEFLCCLACAGGPRGPVMLSDIRNTLAFLPLRAMYLGYLGPGNGHPGAAIPASTSEALVGAQDEERLCECRLRAV